MRRLIGFSLIVALLLALLTFTLISALRRTFPDQIGTIVFEMGSFDSSASEFDELDVDRLKPNSLFFGQQFERLIDPVSTFQEISVDDLDCAPDGQSILVSSQYLYRLDVQNGALKQLTSDPRLIYALAWSADQQQIVFTDVSNRQRSIYIANADGSHPLQILASQDFGSSLAWSPDSRKIALSTTSDPLERHYTISLIDTATHTLDQIYESPDNLGQVSWSPDGTRIAFQMWRQGRFDIYTIQPDGSHLTQLTFDNAQNADPRWSPDGTMISYSALDGSDHYQLYVMNADGSDPHLVFAAPHDQDAFNLCWLRG